MQSLSSIDAEKRLEEYGRNIIDSRSSTTTLDIFLSQFPTFFNVILILAAGFSFFVGERIDGLFILAIIILNSIFGFIQEYNAEKSLEKLKNYTTQVVRVLRNGKEVQIDSQEVVPDDIIILLEGDRIPADGKLLNSFDMEIDEAILTGESLPVRKNDDDEVFLGTLIIKGKGQMQVLATGLKTKFGQIAQTLANIKQDKTPLQKQLSGLGKTLSLIAIFISVLLIPIGISQGKELSSIILLAVSIGVAAIPEGLPAVITIALALGTNRMAKRHAIVRQMPSVETLGSVQVLLVDKTGTLTQNKMRVKDVWYLDKTKHQSLLKATVLGNTASLIQETEGKSFTVAGDQTDGALLLWAKEQDSTLEETLKTGKIIDEFVFDSESKLITTVWQKDATSHIFVRGAPEAVIQRSNLTAAEKKKTEEQIHEYAKSGLRVIGFATKQSSTHSHISREKREEDLTFLGLIGIYDPPREEVKQALINARLAGIRTIMVTGDNDLTALAIAKEIGLVEGKETVLTGDELAKLSDEELLPLLEHTHIFARSKPQDKLRLTNLFKQLGYIIGVSGDGVNDALALKRADVGVAMGQSGTDVAKEASDIIIADDNFATIIKAIEEGRTIYRNIVTAITYLITSNLSELMLVFSSTLLGLPTVLLPTQILWINIATDGLPALALATDGKRNGELNQKPRNPKEPILTRQRLTKSIGVASIMTLIQLLLYILLLQLYSESTARTVIFAFVIFSHLILAFIIRGKSHLKINKLLLLTVAITVILQTIITTTPFFQELFEIGFK